MDGVHATCQEPRDGSLRAAKVGGLSLYRVSLNVRKVQAPLARASLLATCHAIIGTMMRETADRRKRGMNICQIATSWPPSDLRTSKAPGEVVLTMV